MKTQAKKVERQKFVIRGALAAALVAGCLMLLVVGLVGVSYERVYAGRMFPGVTLLGVAMGGKTYDEARSAVAARANAILDHTITLTYADGSSQTITPKELGLKLDPDEVVNQAFLRGRHGSLLDRWSEMALLASSGAAFAFTPLFDTDNFLENLESSLKNHESEPVAATLAIANRKLTITPSKSGNIVDRAKLAADLEESFRKLDLPATLTITQTTLPPDVTEEELQPVTTALDHILSAPITLSGRDQQIDVPKETAISWASVNTETPGLLVWKDDEIGSYVARVAKKIDQPMTPKKLNEKTGTVFDEGQVGYKLDRDKTVASIREILFARMQLASLAPVEPATIELTVDETPVAEKTLPAPFTAGLYPGKYFEVNLTEQELYQWEGSYLVSTYTVSTGKWNTPTPEGILYIKNHIPYAYSRAHDLYMPWWMGLARNQDGSDYDGYGIHELPEWKNGYKEGLAHLGTPVSHGCIRLGIGAAQAMYDWGEDGMPVYIHR